MQHYDEINKKQIKNLKNSSGGEEHKHTSYEILVRNLLGRALNV